jgi:SAM-dependent methyltransferase
VLFRCPSCAHVVRDLSISGKPVRAHAWGGSATFDRMRIGLTMRRLRPLLPRGRRLRILELGFGRGLMLARFLAEGHECHGIEAGMLDVEVDPLVRDRATIHLGIAEEVELPADYFDLAYAIHVVEHLRDPQRVFDKVAASLTPGGQVYFMTPNAESLGLTLFRDKWWNLEDGTHLNFFSFRSITMMLERAGLSGVRPAIPILDSLTIEPNSALKFFFPETGEHGIMQSRLVKALDLALIPPALVARVVVPRLSPSMDVRAVRVEG